MHETRNIAGREFVVHGILELADRAHPLVGLEKIIPAELHRFPPMCSCASAATSGPRGVARRRLALEIRANLHPPSILFYCFAPWTSTGPRRSLQDYVRSGRDVKSHPDMAVRSICITRDRLFASGVLLPSISHLSSPAWPGDPSREISIDSRVKRRHDDERVIASAPSGAAQRR